MHSDSREKDRIAVREPRGRLQIRRPFSGADRQHPLDTGIDRPLNDLVAIGVEHFAIEMAMTVDHHFKTSPDRDVLQEACEHGQSALHARRDDHALRRQPSQFPRSEIRDNHHLAPHQLLRFVS